MDCYWIVFYTTPRSMIMCDQFLLLYAAAFQSMNQLRNKAVLLSYIILSSDPYAAYYISVSILLSLWPDLV